jgi:hypothetical protein
VLRLIGIFIKQSLLVSLPVRRPFGKYKFLSALHIPNSKQMYLVVAIDVASFVAVPVLAILSIFE